MATAAAIVALVALAGCDGGGDEVGTAGRSTSAPTTAGAVTSTTADSGGPTTSTTPGSPSSTTQTPTSRGGGPSSSAPPAGQTPRTAPVEGVTVDYPPGWGPAGQLQATAFANGATCGSAAIVDRALPPNAGPGAQIEQSFVQFCWRGLDGQALPEFMAATYGSAGGFQPTTLAGRPAFVSRAGTSSTYFVDTAGRRYQVATAVTASPALEATRLAEVQRILSSLSLST